MSKFSFVHLLGGTKPANAKEDESEKDRENDETEENEDDGGKKKGTGEPAPASATADATNAAVAKAIADFRDRCAAIFADQAAAGNVALACQLAFETDLSAEQAVKILSAAPAGTKPDRLSAAMAQLGNPKLGTDPSESADASGAGWDKAIGRVNSRRGVKA